MRILIVSATAAEIAPLTATLAIRPLDPPGADHSLMTAYTYGGRDIDVLVTGVGMVATAARTSLALARARYDVALNLGLCGSFDRAIAPGSVVHVVSDRLTELGAEDGDSFLTIQELGLLDDDAPPFTGGWLVNVAPPDNSALRKLPAVRGITVNTAHGSDRSIADVVSRFAPRVESMEGAAFMYACAIHGVPFAQVRAVSNIVEKRNRAAWQIGEAVGGLCAAARELLDAL